MLKLSVMPERCMLSSFFMCIFVLIYVIIASMTAYADESVTAKVSVPGIQVSNWKYSAANFDTSDTYEGQGEAGIELGGTLKESYPIYIFKLPKPRITDEISLESMKVKIYGQGGLISSLPEVIIGNEYIREETLNRSEGYNTYEYSGSEVNDLLSDSENELISYLNVAIDATSGYYDLRNIEVEYTFSGISQKELDQISAVISGWAMMESSFKSHEEFWDASDKSGEQMLRLVQSILLNQMVAVATTDSAWGNFAGSVFEKYVSKQLFGVEGWLDQFDITCKWSAALLGGPLYDLKFTDIVNYNDDVRPSLNNSRGSFLNLIENYYKGLEKGGFRNNAVNINKAIDDVLSELKLLENKIPNLIDRIGSHEQLWSDYYEDIAETFFQGYRDVAGSLVYMDTTIGEEERYTELKQDNSWLYGYIDELETTFEKATPPTGISATQESTEKVNVTWDDAEGGASQYRVWRGVNSNSSDAIPIGNWQATTSYDDINIEPGTTYYYWVKAATDSEGNYASEFSSYDSVSIMENGEYDLPELVITDSYVEPTKLETGQTHSLYANVANQGQGTDSFFDVTWYWSESPGVDSDDNIGPTTSIILSGGYSYPLEDGWNNMDSLPADPGTYYFAVKADANDEVEEVNENNNWGEEIEIEIIDSDLPDFYIESIQLEPTEAKEGEDISVKLVIGNQGEKSGDADYLDLFYNKAERAEDGEGGNWWTSTGILESGEKKTFEHTFQAPSPPGDKTFRAFVNYDNYYTDESDRENNQLAKSYKVLGFVGHGSGTEEDPYLVESAEQLDQLRNCPGSYFRQVNDISLENQEWEPIGTDSNRFTGHFDGNGHVIRNLIIADSNADGIGFFGHTEKAELKNIGIEDMDITGQDNVGGIVGYAVDTIIEASYAKGSVSGGDNIGGLVGYLGAPSSEAAVINSFSECFVNGKLDVGGFIGNLEFHAVLENVYAAGSVEGEANVGGIVGHNYNTGNENVINSFWDTNTGPSSSEGGTGKTTEDMMRQATFTNWDFEEIWGIKDKATYPYLQWQPEPEIECTISVSSSPEEGGTVAGGGTYNYGEDVTVAANAAEDYSFKNWTEAGEEVSKDSEYIFAATTDRQLTANFTENIMYNLTYEAGTGGSIEGESTQLVEEGQDGSSVEAVPDEGYHFVEWGDESTDNPRTDENVTKDITVTAIFEEDSGNGGASTYDLLYEAGTGGSIEGDTTQTVEEGQEGSSVEAVSDEGYHFVEWGDGRTDNPRTDENVTVDISVTAIFEESFKDGSGTEEDPFVIANSVQFERLRDNLTSNFKMEDSIDMEGSEDFEPIGTEINPFTGEFDGGGNILSNLIIDRGESDHVGLFGYTKDSVVKNIGIEDVEINGKSYVGGLAGSALNTNISECYVTGFVDGSETVGGLAGKLDAESLILNSYANCDVNGESAVGGLVGNHAYTAEIENTYAVGEVLGSEDIGGLVGYNDDGSQSNVVNGFWDADVGPDASEGGTGKSTEEMRQQETFAAWNFEEIWAIKDVEAYPYPYLQWQPEPGTGTDDDENDDTGDSEDSSGNGGSGGGGCFINMMTK